MTMNTVKTIVVVDDTPENLRLLAEMLEGQGYRVRLARSGEHALSSVRKQPPDLILLDILMPEMDGFEVCRALKADDKLRDIPVIFVSALDEVFDKVTAFAVGGVDYIQKPFQIEEVLARVRTHLSLREMQQQLVAQNLELEAFAHTVAHDLKSPLANIIGSLDLLSMDAGDLDETSRKILSVSLAAADKMHNIVDELLLLASVRNEGVQVTPVDMRGVIEQALERLTPMLDSYGADVTILESGPEVLGYAPWLEEVWVNYLSNGIKYGGQPPRLELGAAVQADGMIRFWVKDNGKGVALEDQGKLFTEFARLDTLRAQGHGLGLSIVRRIVAKLGGQVGVESTGSQGSLFYFTLPTIPESQTMHSQNG